MSDKPRSFEEHVEVEREEQKASTVRRENARLRAELKANEDQIAQLRAVADLVGRFEDSASEPPKWLSPAKPKAGSHATLMLLLSDMHFDEVVDPAEMDGLNAYDRTIATRRLERWAGNVVKLSRDYLSGVTYDGVVLMLGGDTFSGDIHEELRRTNAGTVFDGLLYWLEQMSAAIDLLAGEYGKVFITAAPGNHGRMTNKPVYKNRASSNLDWLLAKLLERDFRSDGRMSFQIPDSFDSYFHVYGRGQVLTHGDQTRGGGGIGGIWPPIMRMRARKAQVAMATGKPFETLWMGHWHQLIQTPGLIVNGAIKGYDEYAAGNNFTPEPAQQAMAVMTPEHGIAWQAPVFCADRKAEKW
jgi:hypothetical protein